MLRRPVSPRGLWESSVVLSESESSAVVTGGSGFGRCFVVIGAWQLDTDPLCTRGLNIINSRKPSLRDGHTRLLQHKDLRRHRKHLPDLLTVSNSGLIFSWPCQCLALCVCVCVCVCAVCVCMPCQLGKLVRLHTANCGNTVNRGYPQLVIDDILAAEGPG